MYVLAGSVRAHLEFDYATVRRYVYIAGFLLVLAVADWLPLLRARRAVSGSALGVVLAAAVVANVADLRGRARRVPARRRPDSRAYRRCPAERGRALGRPGGDARRDADACPVLLETVERHGSPLRDSLFPSVVRTPDEEAYEAALLRLVGNGFRVEPGGTAAGRARPARRWSRRRSSRRRRTEAASRSRRQARMRRSWFPWRAGRAIHVSSSSERPRRRRPRARPAADTADRRRARSRVGRRRFASRTSATARAGASGSTSRPRPGGSASAGPTPSSRIGASDRGRRPPG